VQKCEKSSVRSAQNFAIRGFGARPSNLDKHSNPSYLDQHATARNGCALANRLANDPALAMARAAVVGHGELVDAENSIAPLGQLIDAGAAHSAQADNDRVKAIHGLRYLSKAWIQS